MSKTKALYPKLVLIAVLAIILGAVVYRNLSTGQPPALARPRATGGTSAPAVPASVAPAPQAASLSSILPAGLLSAPASAPTDSRVAFPPAKATDIAAWDPFHAVGALREIAQPAPQSEATAQTEVHDDGPDEPSAQGSEAPPAKAPPTPKVSAIWRQGDRFAALVDSRLVRSGDTLEGLGRVVDVTPTGIVVEQDE